MRRCLVTYRCHRSSSPSLSSSSLISISPRSSVLMNSRSLTSINFNQSYELPVYRRYQVCYPFSTNITDQATVRSSRVKEVLVYTGIDIMMRMMRMMILMMKTVMMMMIVTMMTVLMMMMMMLIMTIDNYH